MKRNIVLVVVLFASMMLMPLKAEAHVLKADGSIGAVVHIDPDDDPIVGQPSNFYFEFKDKEGKFQPANCDCTVTITQEGKPVFIQPLFQNSSDPSLANASFNFTFPQPDVYTLSITGKPYNEGDFQPFKLSYDLRISRTADAQTNGFLGLHTIHYVLIVLVFIVSIVLTTREKFTKKS